MKRIRIPPKEKGFFHPSLPKASYPAIIFGQWLNTKSPILIVVGSSLSETEVVAEDITALAELHQQNRKQFEFHLLEENPSDSHPEGFERNCNKLSLLSSLIKGRATDDIQTIIAATPESLLAPCPSKKEKKENQMVISRGMELDFGDFQQALRC